MLFRSIREFILQQNAFHPVDTYSELKKTYLVMKTVLRYADLSYAALQRGVRAPLVIDVKAKEKLADVKFEKDYEKALAEIQKAMEKEFDAL